MQLPGPVRAAVGLVVTAADEAKHLPDRAIELPMLAVSSALQLSLRAQQRYARLAARGDEALTRRRTGDEPPAWATFDDPGPAGAGAHDGGAGAASETAETLGRLLAGDEPAAAPVETAAPAKKAAKRASAKKAAPAKKTAQKAAKKTAAARTTNSGSEKTVNKPRHTPPSRFDTVTDGTEAAQADGQRDDG